MVLSGKIQHNGHPVLRWNVDNVYVDTDPAGNIKMDKKKSTEKIDGAVALAMGLDRAIRASESGAYADHDLYVL
jgi:phage terminase large subunit-like protein